MKRLLGLVLVLGACGSDGPGVDDFIGTWTYGAGSTSTFDCDVNAADRTDAIIGNLVVSAGVESDIIFQPGPNDQCPPTKLDVSGNKATAEGNATCTTMRTVNGVVITSMSTIQSVVATIDDDGKRIDAVGSAAVLLSSNAGNATCTFSFTANATKTGN